MVVKLLQSMCENHMVLDACPGPYGPGPYPETISRGQNDTKACRTLVSYHFHIVQEETRGKRLVLKPHLFMDY